MDPKTRAVEAALEEFAKAYLKARKLGLIEEIIAELRFKRDLRELESMTHTF